MTTAMRLTGATLLGGALLVAGTVAPASAAGTVATRTVMTATPSPATTAQLVTLFATVTRVQGTAAQPIGSVSFLDGSTSLGSADITTSPKGRQVASLKVRFTAGSHSLTAHYSGDSVNAASVSLPVTLQVTQAPPVATSTVVTEVAGTTARSAVIRAHVANGVTGVSPATGAVSFAVDNLPAQAVALNSTSRAHLTLTLPTGPHHAVVTYSGDSTHQASTGTMDFTVS